MKTLKEEIDSLHEIPAFRDFQMAVQRIFQGMTEGTVVDPLEAKQSMSSAIASAGVPTTQAQAYYAPLVTFAEEEK